MSTTEDRARKVVAEHLDVEPEKVIATANFVDDLGADSLDAIELLMAFEEEFDIAIDDDEGAAATTFGQAVELIEKRLAS